MKKAMDNNQKAIVYHIRRGATLNVIDENHTASLTYSDGKYVAANYDAALALMDKGVLVETPDGKLQLDMKALSLTATV
jgi:hypothetical protein